MVEVQPIQYLNLQLQIENIYERNPKGSCITSVYNEKDLIYLQ